MDTAVIGLPVATESPIGSSGLPPDISLNQSSSASGAGFFQLLSQVYPALSGDPAAADAGLPAEGQSLQVLPQGGKLLPLLQQVLDGAADKGLNGEEILARIEAKIEQLQTDTDLAPAQLLFAAVNQVARELSGHAAVPAGDGMDVLARDSTGYGRQAERHSALHAIRQQLGITDSATAPDSAQHQQTAEQNRSGALEKLFGELQLSAAAPRPQQTELVSAMAALRRLAAGARPDSAVRADSLVPALNTAPPVVSTTAPPGGALALGVDTPFNQPGWGEAVGERVQWLVGQRLQGAQMRLNPANLGPMEVRVQMHNDQASIQFSASHAVVREALETALPRLREMLENSGVELVDVDISGQSFAEQRRTQENQYGGSGSAVLPQADSGEVVAETAVASVLASGRLDLFV